MGARGYAWVRSTGTSRGVTKVNRHFNVLVAVGVLSLLFFGYVSKAYLIFVFIGAMLVWVVSGWLSPAAAIVDRIRAADSPIVQEVVLHPRNFWAGRDDTVYVYVDDEASVVEVLDLWCNVMLPAGAQQLGRNVGILKNPSNPIGAFPYQYVPTCNGSPAPIG
jgi:hypothetical protein